MSGIRPLPAMSTTTDRAPTRYVPPGTGWLRIPFANLMRRIQCGIDPPPPVSLLPSAQCRKFEIERFPIRIQNDVRQYRFVLQFPADCDAVRERRPVRLIEFHAMPGGFRLAQDLASNSRAGVHVPRRASARRSISNFTNRRTSACLDSRFQSNQLVSLSWQ